MKALMKLAVGAAIAGALVSVILKQRNRGMGQRNESDAREALPLPAGEDIPQGTEGFTVAELIADTSSVGEGSGDDRVLLPPDGRIERAH